MKQFKLYSGMAAVCAMLTFASCGNDIELTEAQAPVKGEYKVTITASQEGSATRTAVDGTNVVWQTGDAITVFDGAGANCPFELAKGAGTTLGEFQGTITVTEPKSYCAVYPATANATIDSDYGISGLVLPVEQVATRDGFDPQAAIMTARNDDADKIVNENEDLSLGAFKHVCAFVKVTTTEEYDRITFTANGGDSIAGGFDAQVGADGISKAIPTSPSCTVSLVPPTGSTKIAAGTYFIAILPGILEEGFTMSCTSIDSDNKEVTTMVRSYSDRTQAFSRHNAVNMGTVEEGVTAVTWTRNTQKYVDLGLTSGTKWATCNVGASSPEGYGDYFAWGETTPKDNYSWGTYKWSEGSDKTLTKYNTNSERGIVDDRTVLELSDDAAHRNWGGIWRMPTRDEFEELKNECYWEWTDNYNHTHVKGFIIYQVRSGANGDKGKKNTPDNNVTPSVQYNILSDKHIFLPAAGFYSGSYLIGDVCNYWGASLGSPDNAGLSHFAYNMYFSGRYYDWQIAGNRTPGESVRPVLK
ncbi:MAG: hypothetical protein II844_03940 [Prevotella sp.]|nr:hypothetical protein [Prevotella sp.]